MKTKTSCRHTGDDQTLSPELLYCCKVIDRAVAAMRTALAGPEAPADAEFYKRLRAEFIKAGATDYVIEIVGEVVILLILRAGLEEEAETTHLRDVATYLVDSPFWIHRGATADTVRVEYMARRIH